MLFLIHMGSELHFIKFLCFSGALKLPI
uniref:Uncharacterized protein n=1 Tax=Arundo donax TaxID=35708 RepID=A0A0A9BRI7_ARUDO